MSPLESLVHEIQQCPLVGFVKEENPTLVFEVHEEKLLDAIRLKVREKHFGVGRYVETVILRSKIEALPGIPCIEFATLCHLLKMHLASN